MNSFGYSRKTGYYQNIFLKLVAHFHRLPGFKKIVIIGIFVHFVSLFFPWMIHTGNEQTITRGPFSLLFGGLGFSLVIILFFLLFILMSQEHKERFKSKTKLFIRDHLLIILLGVFGLVLYIHALFFFFGMKHFWTDNISLWSGLILGIIAGLFVIFGGWGIYREQKKLFLNMLYIETNQERSEEEMYAEMMSKIRPSKKNMTLPM